jgi:two-component system cell cycle response regulator DivK
MLGVPVTDYSANGERKTPMAHENTRTTILYIDDSAVEREVVRHLLEAEGCEVVATGSPQAGVEVARRMVPDLILLDLHMPGMDGWAVARRLHTIPELQTVPIVALSSTINEEERAEVYAVFDGFLKKPVDVDVFPSEVRGYIAKGRDGAAIPVSSPEAKEASEAEPPDGVREALETLERIRSMLSHDLRSPLTVMISYASTVGKGKAGNLSERQKEMLDLVVEQGFKMDADIVELARIARETLDRYGYKP